MTTLDDIRRRMDGVEPHLSREEKLRNEHPGLKELWDQYQTMLKLVTPAKEKKSPDFYLDTSTMKADDLLEQLRKR